MAKPNRKGLVAVEKKSPKAKFQVVGARGDINFVEVSISIVEAPAKGNNPEKLTTLENIYVGVYKGEYLTRKYIAANSPKVEIRKILVYVRKYWMRNCRTVKEN